MPLVSALPSEVELGQFDPSPLSSTTRAPSDWKSFGIHTVTAVQHQTRIVGKGPEPYVSVWLLTVEKKDQ
jgi:hypothetical protein